MIRQIVKLKAFPVITTYKRRSEMKQKMLLALSAAMVMMFGAAVTVPAEQFMVDDFEQQGNALYSKSNIYKKDGAPSDAKKGRTDKEFSSGQYSLYVAYKKEAEGWCGYYIQLISGGKYFDSTPYTKLTFMVKGKAGGENFQIGMADEYWFKQDDSVKSDDITKYLPAGQVTTEWQKAEIPLSVFVDKRGGEFDLTKLGSVAFCFETTCFPDGTGKGVIYLDDVAFE
jgi:hypothetical protein